MVIAKLRKMMRRWASGGRVPASCVLNVSLRLNGKGRVSLGENIILGYPLAPQMGDGAILLQARYEGSQISIGDRTEISNNTSIIALDEITIGSDCLIADRVTIYDADFHELEPESRLPGTVRTESDGDVKPTVIGNNVWIGSCALILKGVTIGDGSVIGAGSVVTKDIPSNVLAVGSPAKVVKSLEMRIRR